MGNIVNHYIDHELIRQAIDMVTEGRLYECRIINGNRVLSGYFKGADTLIQQLGNQYLQGANVYITLQELHPGLESRLQWECFMETGKHRLPSTSDSDVIRYRWLPIDLDPVRPAGISSTREELEKASDLAYHILAYMQTNYGLRVIKAFSGNGYHLLFDMTDKNMAAEDVKEILDRLDELFSNDYVHVDTTVYNPARIFKLYGTTAQKGRNTVERPHRMAKILGVEVCER